jgi:hypothetical protein
MEADPDQCPAQVAATDRKRPQFAVIVTFHDLCASTDGA